MYVKQIPFLSYEAGLHITPGGKYLCAFYKGEWGDTGIHFLKKCVA